MPRSPRVILRPRSENRPVPREHRQPANLSAALAEYRRHCEAGTGPALRLTAAEAETRALAASRLMATLRHGDLREVAAALVETYADVVRLDDDPDMDGDIEDDDEED